MSVSIKTTLKPLIPAPILAHWRRYRFNTEQAHARGRPLEDVFNEIYSRGIWTPEGASEQYHSGPGSMPEVTAGYENFVAGYINAHPEITTLVDIGCGDFQVSNRILSRLSNPVSYIGCDIASLVVADNEKRHGVPGRIEFRNLNVSRDPLPKGDIVTIREVFQHLSNETIVSALDNLRQSFKVAIVTEAVPIAPDAPNLDIVSGYRTRDGLNSGVFLELAPFGLTILDRYEAKVRELETLRTLVVAL
ncbi:MAG: class I SAM-dependent methyltransferase [Hyphomicrobium sp.]